MASSSSPPPVSRRAHFLSPLLDTSDQPEEQEEVESDGIVEPPNIMDAATAKHFDAVALLVSATYGNMRKRRTYAHISLPAQLLEGTDVRWTLAPASPSASGPSPARDASVDIPDVSVSGVGTTSSGGGRRRGHLSLGTFQFHRNRDVAIDSPRSLIVLVRSGEVVPSLRTLDDAVTDERRRHTIDALTAEYDKMCKQFSQEFVVEYFRSVDRTGKGISVQQPSSSPASSPLTSSLRGKETASKQEPSVPRAAGRGSPQAALLLDIKHLQARRDKLVITWGMRQQRLAEEGYIVARVNDALKRRQGTKCPPLRHDVPHREDHSPRHLSVSVSPDAAATKSPLPPPAAEPSAERPAESRTDRSASGGSAPPAGGEVTRFPRPQSNLTGKLKKVDDTRREAMRQRARRTTQLIENLRLKEVRAAAAMDNVRRKHEMQSGRQRSRALGVSDVNGRMVRQAEYARLMTIQALEADAFTEKQRLAQETSEHNRAKLWHKERRTLEHVTRHKVEESTATVDKWLAQQEHAAQARSIDIQRKLQEESRAQLLRAIQTEDALLATWNNELVKASAAPALQQTSPRRSPR